MNPDQCHHGQKQLYPKFQRTPRNSEVSLSIAFCQLGRSRRESILNNGFQSNKTQVTGKIVLPTVSWQAKQIISADAVDSTRISLICIPVIDAINYLKVRLAPLMMIAWWRVKKTNHSLWRRANVRNVSFVISSRWKFDRQSTCLIPDFTF